MPLEIERKFLVHRDRLPALPDAADAFFDLEQGYLATQPLTVRVRVSAGAGEERGELTVKGKGLLSREELNVPIAAADARALLAMCPTRLRKRRHLLGRFELDFFPGLDLWLAEIELSREDEPFERPAWLGAEVTLAPAYSNAALAARLSAL